MGRDTLRKGARGTDVRVLQTDLNAIGAQLLVDGEFGDKTEQTVRDFQVTVGLVEDGVVGPKTWAEIAQALAREDYMKKLREVDKLELAGIHAATVGYNWWKEDIYDPKKDDRSAEANYCKAVIGNMINEREGLGWHWEGVYDGDGDFEWCGAFAATCWSAVKPELRRTYFASTLRLDRYGSYRSFNGEKHEGSGRLYAKCDESTKVSDLPFTPRAGDIILVGPTGYGQHICIVEKFDAAAGIFFTVEGNGNGAGPNGERQHGIVRARRKLGGKGWHVRRIIRPSLEDLA